MSPYKNWSHDQPVMPPCGHQGVREENQPLEVCSQSLGVEWITLASIAKELLGRCVGCETGETKTPEMHGT